MRRKKKREGSAGGKGGAIAEGVLSRTRTLFPRFLPSKPFVEEGRMRRRFDSRPAAVSVAFPVGERLWRKEGSVRSVLRQS